jgi:putative SOS response-associated peptidase YedK
MCGRYVVATNPEQLALDFGAAQVLNLDGFAADYNVAPTKPVPVVLTLDRTRVLLEMTWGMVPSWAKDPAVGSRMINARVETVAEKPTFRRALVRRRCLLPADGYYEWRKPAEGASKASGGRKQPYYIHRADGGLLAFAGLYDHWLGSDGSELWTAAILTGAATPDLAAIHDRMPLTVPPDRRDAWLDPDLQESGQVTALLELRPDWVARPVSTQVNSVRNAGPELTEEIAEPVPTVPAGTRAAKPGMDEPDTLF